MLNREKNLAQRKEHYAENKERLNAISRDYYQKNIESQRASGLARHHLNRDKRVAQMRAYLENNRDQLNARRRPKSNASFKERYGKDLQFTLKHRVGSLVRVTLKNGRKGGRMREILGFDTQELKIHLERQFTAGMNWDKFLDGQIHIDHIIPVDKFKPTDSDSKEFKACWSLGNLRPLWKSENLSKAAKILTLL